MSVSPSPKRNSSTGGPTGIELQSPVLLSTWMAQSFPPGRRSAGWATGSPPQSPPLLTSPKGWPRPRLPSWPSSGSLPRGWVSPRFCATLGPPHFYSPSSAPLGIPSDLPWIWKENSLPSGIRSRGGPQIASPVCPLTSWPSRPACFRSVSSSHTSPAWPALWCYASPRRSPRPPPDYHPPCRRRHYTPILSTSGASPVASPGAAYPFPGSSRGRPPRTGPTSHWIPFLTLCSSSSARMASPPSRSPPSTCSMRPTLPPLRVVHTPSSSSSAGTSS